MRMSVEGEWYGLVRISAKMRPQDLAVKRGTHGPTWDDGQILSVSIRGWRPAAPSAAREIRWQTGRLS